METKVTTESSSSTERTRSGRTFCPAVDILENEDALVVLADVPGSRAEDIGVDFENGQLTIHARVTERQPEGTRFLAREYALGDYRRSFEVSERIDPARIAADYTNGVLRLTLPKAESAKPKKIVVRTN